MLLVSDDLELHLVAPALANRFEQGFSYAQQKGQQHIEVPYALLGNRRPIAMAAGYLDPPPQDFVHVKRKMVVVVVTAGWVVTCLDHNLKIMWQTSIHDTLPEHAATQQVRPPPRPLPSPWHLRRTSTSGTQLRTTVSAVHSGAPCCCPVPYTAPHSIRMSLQHGSLCVDRGSGSTALPWNLYFLLFLHNNCKQPHHGRRR